MIEEEEEEGSASLVTPCSNTFNRFLLIVILVRRGFKGGLLHVYQDGWDTRVLGCHYPHPQCPAPLSPHRTDMALYYGRANRAMGRVSVRWSDAGLAHK